MTSSTNMTIDSHSDILNAYVSRMSIADVKQLLHAVQYSMEGAMNHGSGEQLRRDLERRQVVREIVENMIEYDQRLITATVRKTVNGDCASCVPEVYRVQGHDDGFSGHAYTFEGAPGGRRWDTEQQAIKAAKDFALEMTRQWLQL